MSDIEAAFATFFETYSLAAAQGLEVALDETYPDDPLVQEFVEMLAAYRPEGGEFLFDAQLIAPHLQRIRAHLGIGS